MNFKSRGLGTNLAPLRDSCVGGTLFHRSLGASSTEWRINPNRVVRIKFMCKKILATWSVPSLSTSFQRLQSEEEI